VLTLLVISTSACGGKTSGSDGTGAGTSGAGTGGSASGTGGATGGGTATGGSSGTATGGDAGASAAGGATSTGGAPMGGQSGAGNGGDAGAASGSGGASGAGTGGDAGAGVAGSGGGAGAAGIGTAGAAGAAGAPSGAECVTDDDCMRISDCCACTAEPKDQNNPTCDRFCIEDRCFDLIITAEAVCAFGRCVFDLSCDGSEATCPALPPDCTAGTVPSVVDGCWGPCIPPTECRSVSNCDACTAVGAACVTNDLILLGVGCVELGECEKGNLCECLDACPVACSETETGVGCYCPAC